MSNVHYVTHLSSNDDALVSLCRRRYSLGFDEMTINLDRVTCESCRAKAEKILADYAV